MSSDFFNCCYSDKVTSQTNFEAILLYFRKLNIMIKSFVLIQREMIQCVFLASVSLQILH